MPHRIRFIAALAAIAFASPLVAQSDGSHAWIFRPPVFLIQPGLVTSNIIDAPAGTSSKTEFNARVVTAIPLTLPATALVAIVQFTPFATTNVGGTDYTTNAPSFVFGPVFHVIDTSPFALDLDVLDSYGPRARNENEDYTHKLVFEGDAYLKIGSMMMPPHSTSHWAQLSIYGFLANVATGLPSGASRWVALYGLSLPIAP